MEKNQIEREENRLLLQFFSRISGHQNSSEIIHPGEESVSILHLGVHPDLVDRLWKELTILLPEDCRRVVGRRPVLLHPQSYIIFGFAIGTHTYALRLPPALESQALSTGAKKIWQYPKHEPMDLNEIGAGWVWCGWHKDEPLWCLAAYERDSEKE